MRLLALLLVPVLWGSSISTGGGALAARNVTQNVDYYVSKTGNDANGCTSGAQCLTLARALSLIPQVLQYQYVIHVGDGTYNEPIDTYGFIGVGMGSLPTGSGTHMTSIEILGNTTTPANVVFTGAAQCDSVFTSIGCMSGSGKIILHGLKLTGSNRNIVTCQNGVVEFNKVVIVQTGGPTINGLGFLAFGCRWNMEGDFTISGFDAPDPMPTGGAAIQMQQGSVGTINGGALLMTGPGVSGGADGTTCIALENGANSLVVTGFASATSITCNQVNNAFWIAANSVFEAAVATTVTLSNSGTPTNSYAILMSANGTFYMAFGANLVIDHWSTCFFAQGQSIMTQGEYGGSRSVTNCGTVSTLNDGSVLALY